MKKGNVECAGSRLLQFWRSEIVEETFGGAACDGVSEGAEGELGSVHDARFLRHAQKAE